MAKIYGLNGIVRGRLGNTVYVSSKGEVIARTYQPVVANPKTIRQETSRTKLKVASGVCRGLKNVLPLGNIAEGKISARNMYMRRLIKTASAWVTPMIAPNAELKGDFLNEVSLTKGDLPLPGMTATIDSEEALIVTATFSQDILTAINNCVEQYKPADTFSWGIVGVCWQPDGESCVIESATLEDLTSLNRKLTFTTPSFWSGMTVYVAAFVKLIPNAYNGVLSSTEPWKFPAMTSPSYYLGTTTVI